VLASAAFGLIVAQTQSWTGLPTAIGSGFLFGTSFIGGTGYRIVMAAVQGQQREAPASWSGATAGAALLALVMYAVAVLTGGNGGPVLLGFGVGINLAYLLAKFACVSAGCCHADAAHRLAIDLRSIEIGATIAILAGAAALAWVNLALAALVAIAGHLAVRLLSRRSRGRWSWGWPPLRQPGAEIAPLAMLVVVSVISLTAG
jgi:hypothetical protein